MANIMLADDSKFMRGILKKILGSKHQIVAEASNGLEAVRLYAEFKPDILCMDITMPKVNGLDSLRYIMELDAKAKVIMCSAIGQEWAKQDALNSGAKAFLIKPFEKDQLLNIIDILLKEQK
jgi:two-component system chemotaxis response regulator CheY